MYLNQIGEASTLNKSFLSTVQTLGSATLLNFGDFLWVFSLHKFGTPKLSQLHFFVNPLSYQEFAHRRNKKKVLAIPPPSPQAFFYQGFLCHGLP